MPPKKSGLLPTVVVEPELRDALEALAREQDVSIGHIIRLAARDYVEKHGKPAKKTGRATS